jgi:hypothetical protein
MLVHVPANVTPRQVEFPAEVSERKGSLHIRPISNIEISDGELAHLKKTDPKLHDALIPMAKKATLKERLAAKAPKPAAPALEGNAPTEPAPTEPASEEPAEPAPESPAPRRRPR